MLFEMEILELASYMCVCVCLKKWDEKCRFNYMRINKLNKN